MRRILFLLFLSLALGGRSEAQQDPLPNLQQTMPSEDSWWQIFGDPTLIRLIDKSVSNNYNLRNTVKNIQTAKSRWRSQQGKFFPSVSVSARYAPEKSSLGIDHADIYSHIGQAGIEMNWEIDVFGNIRKEAKAQKEYYLASIEDYRGAMVSLASEVAMAYIRLRTYQQQLEVARNNLESQEEILRINEAQLAAGLASKLTVAQSKGLWLQTKAALPGLEASIASEANTLAVLTGEYSDSLRQALLHVRPLPQGKPLPMQGIPAELIRRRPDVRADERTMDALAAAAGATRADWWPKFYLTGAFGYGNEYYKQFFKKENMTWQISPSIKWTVFSGGQIAQANRQARIQLDEGINTYNQTLLTALQEVDDALSSYHQSLQQLEADRLALEEIELSLEYAVDLYRKGLTNYQNVLDSQRNALSYENKYVSSQSATLLNMIQVYKALGGGLER